MLRSLSEWKIGNILSLMKNQELVISLSSQEAREI